MLLLKVYCNSNPLLLLTAKLTMTNNMFFSWIILSVLKEVSTTSLSSAFSRLNSPSLLNLSLQACLQKGDHSHCLPLDSLQLVYFWKWSHSFANEVIALGKWTDGLHHKSRSTLQQWPLAMQISVNHCKASSSCLCSPWRGVDFNSSSYWNPYYHLPYVSQSFLAHPIVPLPTESFSCEMKLQWD